MSLPQPGIFALGTPENAYLELDLAEGVDVDEVLRGLVNTQNFTTEGTVNLVIGVRPSLWRAKRPDATPADAEDWTQPITGSGGFEMPATPHDLWVWIAGPDRAVLFDATMEVRSAIAHRASVASETAGWHYKQSRDLTGFVDGSANPNLLDAPAVACVPAGRQGEGACILVYQLWHHEQAWLELSVHDQELAMGRSKQASIEMSEAEKPPTSHVARTVIDVDGHELDIFRHNVAYGTTGDHGTVFVGFSQDQWRQFEMLRRMAGGDGVRDTLTRFTTPLSGAVYIIPSATALRAYVEPSDD